MKRILITILFLSLFIPQLSLAAEIFVDTKDSSLGSGEDFLVQVYLNTGDVSVNAVEGKVLFPKDYFTLKEIREGNSSINFWVEKPESLKDGEVSFSGITTGGFVGPKRLILGLVLRTKKSGDSQINLSNVVVLANDGQGTTIATKIKALSLSTTGEVKDANSVAIVDNEQPEQFNISVGHEDEIFDGKNFLVFSTVDKASGVNHYEVRESYWGLGGDYVKSNSPYLIQDQSLKSRLYVKAVDNSGNERIAKLGPQNKLVFLEQFIIIVIILTICFFIYRKIFKRISKKYY